MKYIWIIFLSLTFIFAADCRHKCGFAEAVEAFNSGQRLTRPVSDTYAISPSGHFYVHYFLSGQDAPDPEDMDANGVPDYIDQVGIMADSIRHVLVDVMGYDPEQPDSDGIYDIYTSNRAPGSYGVTTPESPSGSYIQIDNDFSTGYYIPGINTMRLTIAHEFFHAIQLGYRIDIADNRFFYEMSSTWIEDVVVPDGDDYVYWVWDFFDRPWININETDGYSIALFGHYLSRIVDGYQDETGSSIIRGMWECFDHAGNTALACMMDVLEEDYNSSLAEAWVNWNSSNCFNGWAPSLYYYEDQAITPPLYPTPALMYGQENFTLNMDVKSLAIKSFIVSNPDATQGVMQIEHSNSDYLGNIVIVSSVPDQNAILVAEDEMVTPVFNILDKVYFLYAHPDSNNEEVEITAEPLFTPLSPENLVANATRGKILLSWDASPGPGENIWYNVYQNGILLDETFDTVFLDLSVQSNHEYSYTVTAVTSIGESPPSESYVIQSWPDSGDVTFNRINVVYPNPVNLNSHDNFNILLDSKADYSHPYLELIDVRGRRVFMFDLQSFDQGRRRISSPDLSTYNLASGIYFIRIYFGKGKPLTQKITLIN